MYVYMTIYMLQSVLLASNNTGCCVYLAPKYRSIVVPAIRGSGLPGLGCGLRCGDGGVK